MAEQTVNGNCTLSQDHVGAVIRLFDRAFEMATVDAFEVSSALVDVVVALREQGGRDMGACTAHLFSKETAESLDGYLAEIECAHIGSAATLDIPQMRGILRRRVAGEVGLSSAELGIFTCATNQGVLSQTSDQALTAVRDELQRIHQAKLAAV